VSAHWRRNLVVIWFAELVAIIGFSVILPILPLYIQELGVQGDRQIRLWSGIIFSAHAVTMAIFGPIWGALSDRYGRKVMVERAMFSGAVLVGLMALAQNVQQVVILRLLQGALTGTVTAATALVATSVPREQVGFSLGTLQIGIYLGASVGPLLGGWVADMFGYPVIFIATAGLLCLAAVSILLFVREEFHPAAPARPLSPWLSKGGMNESPAAFAKRLTLHQRVWNRLAPIVGSSVLLGLLGVRLMMRLASRLVGPVLPLFIQDLVAPDAPVASIAGLVSGLSALAGAVGAFGLGRLGDRIGHRVVLIVCAAVSCACYVPQYFVTGTGGLMVWQMGAGLMMGGVLASVSASLAHAAPEGQEGIVYGLDASVVSVANAIAPMVGSALAAWLGLRVPFLFAAIVFGLAGIGVVWLLPGRSVSLEGGRRLHQGIGDEHRHEPAPIEGDEAAPRSDEGSVSQRQSQQHPHLTAQSDYLLDDDDGEQPAVAPGMPDRQRVGDVPHQKEDTHAAHEHLARHAADLEPGGISCWSDDKGYGAGDVEEEDGAQGQAGQPQRDVVTGHFLSPY